MTCHIIEVMLPVLLLYAMIVPIKELLSNKKLAT